jgi:hypothetical protein
MGTWLLFSASALSAPLPTGRKIDLCRRDPARATQYCRVYADRYATVVDGAYHAVLTSPMGSYPAGEDIPECAEYLALWTKRGDGRPRGRPEMRHRGYQIRVWQRGYLGGYGEQMKKQGLKFVVMASHLDLRTYQFCVAQPDADLQDAMEAYLRNTERFWRSFKGPDTPPTRPVMPGEPQPAPWQPPPASWNRQ